MRNSGRPLKKDEDKKLEHLDIRLELVEKQAFKDAARIAGVPLSVWVRERLRQSAIKELSSVNHEVAFFKKINLG